MTLTRHQVLLRKGDWDRLMKIYPKRAVTSIIRDLVARHIGAAEARNAAEEAKRMTA